VPFCNNLENSRWILL